jgi:preprotein translocase subunit SecD
MRRNQALSLLGIVVVAAGALILTLATGKRPLLGLDLRGGASVVLHPTTPTDSDKLNQAISIIRTRVDALGVAEPDISRQGNDILVQLPGIKDTERALSIVGQTAQLTLRPVLNANPQITDTKLVDLLAAACDPKGHPNVDLPPNDATGTVVLPVCDAKTNAVARADQLGQVVAQGNVISSASAVFDTSKSAWAVNFTLTGTGSKQFDDIAAKCFAGDATCPTKQLAIVLDRVIKSDPTIQQASFNGNGQITGNFTQRESKDLALVLKYGSLPVELKPLTQQTVSATLGKGSLKAGIVAGAIGLGAVLLYMLLYYRALGAVVVIGLCVSGALMWSILTLLSTQRGLALSLAGATGVIVAIGVTVDSYIVYFERLKDEIRAGRTVRSSTDRGFAKAWRTTLAADATSFIGAVILYWLTVGAVRGFAFTLGLATLLDVAVCYLFTRPMVGFLARSRFFTEARFFGVARGLAAGGTA